MPRGRPKKTNIHKEVKKQIEKEDSIETISGALDSYSPEAMKNFEEKDSH